ncbi:hypothetical protein TTHERM_01018350 (macronuclear) [Tetrahymena thermophila SB210]|uniref:Uncharacterized protein n=1 Tax=Tetrahymena thermophila (strain SB210) TaxID=312017 RepID=Q22XP1_TETTS|nr:hypothetical protein TTHERM_01018350 [Tetrahymena thermophila SB210]EAR90038.1 hypothetical protein TTHERM_01018350 [Tetrahymena thermophila SB210]|eukprot:XP_001010283.1 hypothetical protein TTHERM_01018350 [Tetrahymena thermophila SB210]
MQILKKCTDRESNPGQSDGNALFYHQTIGAFGELLNDNHRLLLNPYQIIIIQIFLLKYQRNSFYKTHLCRSKLEYFKD